MRSLEICLLFGGLEVFYFMRGLPVGILLHRSPMSIMATKITRFSSTSSTTNTGLEGWVIDADMWRMGYKVIDAEMWRMGYRCEDMEEGL